tara:strand:+ start:1561 stop:1983 length:423 start_codon:yes stop_codon:yes gene_type:complete
MPMKMMSLEKVNKFNQGTAIKNLGIEIIEITESTVSAKMPVDERTKQPMGLLHGGASVLLIESIGSIGSSLMVDLEREYPVGLEVNANHVGSASSGFVIGTGKVIHEGKKTHIWSVEIRDEESDRLISVGRLTVMIVEKK